VKTAACEAIANSAPGAQSRYAESARWPAVERMCMTLTPIAEVMAEVRITFTRLAMAMLIVLAIGAWSPTAHAQLMARTTLIENVTIHLPDGGVIDNGAVAIRGARIVGVGTSVTVPRNAIRIDGAGMHVTPGLIDVSSALGMSAGDSGGSLVTASAADAFDRYDARAIEDALGHGVTMIAVAPSGHRGFGPAASIVRLRPDGNAGGSGNRSFGNTLEERVALTLNMRSTEAPMARLQLVDAIRARLREAREREKAIEVYEKAIEEFMKKAEEKRKEKEGDNPPSASTPPSPAPAARGQQRGSGATPPPPPPGDQPRPRRPRPGTNDGGSDRTSDDGADLGEFEEAAAAPVDDLQQRPPRRGPQPPAQAAPSARPATPAAASARPQRPPPNRQLDILITALYHEIPVRVQADRAEDILNALEIAEEFGLKIIIEGGAEAHFVARELAAAEVPVILTTGPTDDLPRSGAQLRARRDAVFTLEKAGVEWAFGSGGGDPRNLLMAAQLLAQQSALPLNPLELVTQRAAKFLGVDDRVGRVEEGLQADLVLWSGDPAEPASRVQRVWIAGDSVYERKESDS